MIAGLQLMSVAELRRLAFLAGASADLVAGKDKAELLPVLVNLIGDIIGCPTSRPEHVERGVLEFLSDAWGVVHAPDDTTDELEERVFFQLCLEASRQLMPTWKLAACMASLGRASARKAEILFLERVADRLIPSEAVRESMQAEWETVCELSPVGEDKLLESMGEEFSAVRHHRHMIRPTLILCLLVALSDGSIEADEATMYRTLAYALHLTERDADILQETVTTTFWKHLTSVGNDERDTPDRIRQAAVIAAYLTLEELGTLESLEHELLHVELQGIHSLLADPDFHLGVEGWRRRGYLWPLGFVVGFGHYLMARLENQRHHHLAAVAYLAWARQREPGINFEHC